MSVDVTDCAINIKQMAALFCDMVGDADMADEDLAFKIRCAYDGLADLCRLMSQAVSDEHDESFRLLSEQPKAPT